MQQGRIDNIITQIDPERLISDIEHRIRRMRKDYHSGTWIRVDSKQPEVSPLLISNLVSYLSAFLTTNITFSNFTEQEINRIMKLLISDVIEDIVSNAENYGLENDYSERNRITGIIFASVFSALKRAHKGIESFRFWRSISISGNVDQGEQSQQQRRKLSDYLKFW
jgi:hypothetical protein